MGLEPDTAYSRGRTVIEPGDTLLIYSDGLPDARPELPLDSTGVATELRDTKGAQAMLEQLVELVGETASRPDDLTLVVVRRQDGSGTP